MADPDCAGMDWSERRWEGPEREKYQSGAWDRSIAEWDFRKGYRNKPDPQYCKRSRHPWRRWSPNVRVTHPPLKKIKLLSTQDPPAGGPQAKTVRKPSPKLSRSQIAILARFIDGAPPDRSRGIVVPTDFETLRSVLSGSPKPTRSLQRKAKILHHDVRRQNHHWCQDPDPPDRSQTVREIKAALINKIGALPIPGPLSKDSDTFVSPYLWGTISPRSAGRVPNSPSRCFSFVKFCCSKSTGHCWTLLSSIVRTTNQRLNGPFCLQSRK